MLKENIWPMPPVFLLIGKAKSNTIGTGRSFGLGRKDKQPDSTYRHRKGEMVATSVSLI